jgi:uncharacterized membrane protein YebE (DUF533 family)
MNADLVLSRILSSGAGSGFAGGLAGGLLGGLLTSKAGRRFGKRALALGGVAAVAGLAWAGFQRWRSGQGARPASLAPDAAGVPEETLVAGGFLPPRNAVGDELGRWLLRAMIAAAHADGRLDATERGALFERIAAQDLPAGEKAELWDEIQRPVDLEALARAATTRERASELYAAALLAIDVDTEAERAWLRRLAAKLVLPAALVDALHREAGLPDELPARVEPPRVDAA